MYQIKSPIRYLYESFFCNIEMKSLDRNMMFTEWLIKPPSLAAVKVKHSDNYWSLHLLYEVGRVL